MSQPLKVLVIDDSKQILEFVIECLLKPKGFEVEVAQDGLTGLNKALTTAPDLILLDYELPYMNGKQVLRQLRSRRLKAPVILMTANDAQQLATEVFLLGVQNCLIKPFSVEAAMRAIGEALPLSCLEGQELLQQVVQPNQELKQPLNRREVTTQFNDPITLIHPSEIFADYVLGIPEPL